MSAAPGTPYNDRIFKNQRGELYFTMVHCPTCDLTFRLLWPSDMRNYPERAMLHLECPGCNHTFTSKDLKVGKLFHVACGCESYPAAPVLRIEPAR